MMLINGRPETTLDARDRGLHYGDGVFETVAVRDGSLRQWARHMARLQRGCQRLGLPGPDVSVLQDEALRLCAGAGDAVLKVIWTRGPGGRGYSSAGAETPTRVVARYPAPSHPATHRTEGVRARWCRHRLGHNPALAGIKHLNRLDQVLARSEWQDAEIAEGLVCDLEGHVICGTMSNVFIVRDGRLATPELMRCGIEGVTRERILELAQTQGIPCSVESITPEQLLDADEVFVCNSVNGLWQLRWLDQRHWQPGAFCHRLRSELEQSD